MKTTDAVCGKLKSGFFILKHKKGKSILGWEHTIKEEIYSLWYCTLKLAKIHKPTLDFLNTLVEWCQSCIGKFKLFVLMVELLLFFVVSTKDVCERIKLDKDLLTKLELLLKNYSTQLAENILENPKFFTKEWRDGIIKLLQFVLFQFPNFGWMISSKILGPMETLDSGL